MRFLPRASEDRIERSLFHLLGQERDMAVAERDLGAAGMGAADADASIHGVVDAAFNVLGEDVVAVDPLAFAATTPQEFSAGDGVGRAIGDVLEGNRLIVDEDAQGLALQQLLVPFFVNVVLAAAADAIDAAVVGEGALLPQASGADDLLFQGAGTEEDVELNPADANVGRLIRNDSEIKLLAERRLFEPGKDLRVPRMKSLRFFEAISALEGSQS